MKFVSFQLKTKYQLLGKNTFGEFRTKLYFLFHYEVINQKYNQF